MTEITLKVDLQMKCEQVVFHVRFEGTLCFGIVCEENWTKNGKVKNELTQ